MNKNFLPILVIVGAVSAALIWTQTPRHVTRLPKGLRATMRGWMRTAHGLPSVIKSHADDHTPVMVMTSTQSSALTPPTHPVQSAPVAAPAAQNPAPAAQEAAPVAQVAVASVRPTSPIEADWCVFKQTTPVQTLDDKPLSNVPGGRFFVIERRARATNGGTLLIGNFTPKRLPHTVQVNSRNVLCLTGSPDDLSTAQRHALRMYYQLRSEAMDYLAEMRKTNGDVASPFYRQVLDAERIRDFRAKELEGMSTLTSDQRAVEMEELAKLKKRAAELREQHDAWKREHWDEITDPRKDPHYKELVREYRGYTATVPAGLTAN